jgi:dipeptidyl aminopeptidase/acylaminoacyl peptidase
MSRTRILQPLSAWLVVISLCLPLPAQAPPKETTRKLDLTIDEIMRGPGLTGYEPSAVRWTRDGAKVYFSWKQYSDPIEKDLDTYVVDRDGTGLRKLSDEEADNAPPAGGDLSKDKSRTVYARKGDIFLYEHATGKTVRLTRTTEAESEPRFTRDSAHVTFVRGGNLFKLALDGGELEQLTDILPANAPPDPNEEKKGTASQEVVKKEERALIEVVDLRARKKEEERAKEKKENPRKPLRLAARQSVVQLLLSPDETYVLATFRTPSDKAKRTIVPNFVTESGYTEDIRSRTNVGDVQPARKVGFLRVDTGEVKWLDHGMKEPVKEDQPEQVKSQEKERDIDFYQPKWSDDGSKLVMLAHAADNKDRWVMALDPATGKTRPLMHLHDDAWVDGPCSRTLGWLKDNQTVYYVSEASGWAHLYTVPFDGGEPKQLTSGQWEVKAVTLSEDGKSFYLETSEENPGEWQVYRMSVEGGPRTRVTEGSGKFEATVSPDQSMLALVHSTSNRPPELYLMQNRPGARMVKVTTSPAPEFFTYPWIDPPVVAFRARDGVMLPARIYKPAGYPKGGPAVIFVHGAGYLQNVHHWWSEYFREYMFHHLLMKHGYLVFDVDYRGSAGYGRDWRTAIYRHMGGKDLDDQVDAAKWLVSEQGVDPKRIGIYGGSYGGFITLMAMFTTPDVFAAGAALRPVTDWMHYNNGYTSDILNVPQDDLEAYKRSSPIYFAAGLKGALLICHGMADTNVHFQDSVRLEQRLIELRKTNWELASYPVENHGFVQPTSWADEYKRIFKLFEDNLKK